MPITGVGCSGKLVVLAAHRSDVARAVVGGKRHNDTGEQVRNVARCMEPTEIDAASELYVKNPQLLSMARSTTRRGRTPSWTGAEVPARLRHDETNLLVWNLLSRDPVYSDLVERAVSLEMVKP